MLNKFDLKITLQTNHFTNESWHELFEIKSGEVLCEGNLKECEEHYSSLDNSKYELLPN